MGLSNVASPPTAPLSSIAEVRDGSGGEDSEEEEEEEEGGWKTADVPSNPHGSLDEGVIKAGYLWKKGERRKVCGCSLIYSCRFNLSANRPGKSAGLF